MSFDLGYGGGDSYGGGDPLFSDSYLPTDPLNLTDPNLAATMDPTLASLDSSTLPIVDGGFGTPDAGTYADNATSDIGVAPLDPYSGFGMGDTGPTSDTNVISQDQASVTYGDTGTVPGDVVGSNPGDPSSGGGFWGALGAGAASLLTGVARGLTGGQPMFGGSRASPMARSYASAGGRSPVYFGGVRPQIPSNLAPVARPAVYQRMTTEPIGGGGDMSFASDFLPAASTALDTGGGGFLSSLGTLAGRYLPTILAGAGGAAAGAVAESALSGGGARIVGGARGPVAVQTTTRSGRAVTVYYVPRGRALLFSGDFAACKRVAKVGHMCSRYMRHRGHSGGYARRRRRVRR